MAWLIKFGLELKQQKCWCDTQNVASLVISNGETEQNLEVI